MDIKDVFKVYKLKDAFNILDKYLGKVKIISGGTDIIIKLNENKLNTEFLLDISDIKEINFINEYKDYIEIGSGVNFTKILTSRTISDKFKSLSDAAKSVGSPQIRNRGTIGGNIVNGSPAADTAPPLISLGAKCIIKSSSGEREVYLEDFYLGKEKVDILDNEILYSIKINKLKENEGSGFSKLGFRNALAISKLNIGMVLGVQNGVCVKCKIASGALSTFPIMEEKIESLIKGNKLDNEFINIISNHFEEEIKLRLSGRESMDFKSTAVKGIFKEALNKALNNI